MSAYLEDLLAENERLEASDLHLQSNKRPLMRVNGKLQETDREIPSPEAMEAVVREMISPEQWQTLESTRSLDFSYQGELSRFRVNAFYTGGKMAAVFRRISERAPSLAEIEAPETLLRFARQPRGLVLVTGPTGSGKSTTLAAMVRLINEERSEHILTIEDPVEFIHQDLSCLVSQREIGSDSLSFADALRDGMREDPDIILLGEMRDYETISIALTAAETGHLVFGTLHTSSAPGTIDRVVDSFPTAEQEQARIMLGNSLVGVLAQTLVPDLQGGRVAAHEILVANNPVRAMVRKQDTAQMRSVLQTSFGEGMQTMDRSLVALVQNGRVSEEEARSRSQNPEEFEQMLRRLADGKIVEEIPRLRAEDLAREMSS